jgi:CRP/FNR family cyclic AMP-dependent transcriptional regulator
VNLSEVLQNNYLFRGLSGGQQGAIINLARPTAFNGGDVMVRQFDKNSDLMIVLSGSARIKSFSGDMLAEVGAGSVIGEVSLLDDQPRSATVVAVGPTEAAVIPSAELRGLMSSDASLKAQLLENLGKLLCQRLRIANIQLDASMPAKAMA